MNVMKTFGGLAVAGLLALVPAAWAQYQSTDQNRSHTKPARTESANRMTTDTNFVTKAAHANMAEVELGKLAKDKASNAEVKQFAQRMIDDHGKANDELKDIASKKNVNWPSDLDRKAQATKDRLSKLSGADFDRAYMEDMVKDHRTDVAEFKRESERATDPDVKAWASKTLPTLEDHLKMAENTQKTVKTEKK